MVDHSAMILATLEPRKNRLPIFLNCRAEKANPIFRVKWIVFEASTVLDQSGTNGINVGVYCLARLAGSSVEIGSPKLQTLCFVVKPVGSKEYIPK